MYLFLYTSASFLLLCSFVTTQGQTSNPECAGIEQIMNSFENTIKKIPLGSPSIRCSHNQQCTGFSCSGSIQSRPFSFNITLDPCTPRPELKFEGMGSHSASGRRELVFHDGERQKVFQYSVLNVYLIPTLKKTDSTHITIGASIQYCPVFPIIGEFGCQTLKGINSTVISIQPCSHTDTVPPSALPTTAVVTSTSSPSTHNTDPTTTNPECNGMEQLTEDLQNSLPMLNCTRNAQCTGFTCDDDFNKHKRFSFNMTLYHCSGKPRLAFSGHGVTQDGNHGYLKEDFYDGDKKKIVNYSQVVVYLTVLIKDQDNAHVVISAHVDACRSGKCLPTNTVVDNLVITVKPCNHTGTGSSIPPTTAVSTRQYSTGSPGSSIPPTTAVSTRQYSTGSPEPTVNPECSGMEAMKNDLTKSLPFLQCSTNGQCTGFSCNGKVIQHKFSFDIILDHCSGKPKLVYTGHGVTSEGTGNLSEDFYDGDRHKIIDFEETVVYLTVDINEKDSSHILISGHIEMCSSATRCRPKKTVVNNLVIAVKPCLHTGSTTMIPPTKAASIPTHARTPTVPTTRKISTPHRPTRGDHGTDKHRLGYRKHVETSGHHMSSGAIAGIVITCLVIIAALLVGVWYLKRGRRVSRLRSAYYNDISMNDPLYDDFDPAEA